MVYTSIPAYLDPANWQQRPNHHPIVGITTTTNSSISHHLPPPPPSQTSHPQPPPQPTQQQQQQQHQQHQQQQQLQHHQHVNTGGGAPMAPGSIRPGSMAERARMANIPMPEPAQKCPRCDSTNTKFCYFNNYSLSQPRHFCKTCRRYWTRGGALRNVPVGGGCRRNKRSSKGNSSKSSPATSDNRSTGNSSANSNPSNSTATPSVADILGLTSHIPPLRFMAPLHHLSEFSHGGGHELGLNYGGMSTPLGLTSEMSFHLGGCSGRGDGSSVGNIGNSFLSSGGAPGGLELQQWRQMNHAPQFPFLSGLDAAAASNLYPFEGAGSHIDLSNLSMGGGGQVRPKFMDTGGVGNINTQQQQQVPPVKNEDNNQEMNLSTARQFLGIQGSNSHEQLLNWNGNPSAATAAWTDLSGLHSSSTSSGL